MQSENINEIATALAKAQGEIENATKKSVNPHFKSNYADLAEVLKTVRPVFAKNGIAIIQSPSYADGMVSVETMLAHVSGQWISGIISAPVGKQDAQAVGSATTYCRRYALAAFAGIAQEDDDGNAAKASTVAPVKSAYKLDPAIVKAFTDAASIEDLSAAWNSIPVGLRKEYAATKDAAKERINA